MAGLQKTMLTNIYPAFGLYNFLAQPAGQNMDI